jgi:hypothetical protein
VALANEVYTFAAILFFPFYFLRKSIKHKGDNMETKIETINGRPRVVATIPIIYNGKEDNVKIKKLNFGEFNELQKASMKITMIGTTPKIEMDNIAMNEQGIVKSLIEAPFEMTLEAVRELDREVAEKILAVVNELNNPSDKKKEN